MSKYKKNKKKKEKEEEIFIKKFEKFFNLEVRNKKNSVIDIIASPFRMQYV